MWQPLQTTTKFYWHHLLHRTYHTFITQWSASKGLTFATSCHLITWSNTSRTMTLAGWKTCNRSRLDALSPVRKFKQVYSSFLVTFTTSWVIVPQIEETLFAAITELALHIFFAVTLSTQGITQASAIWSSRVATTCWNVIITLFKKTANKHVDTIIIHWSGGQHSDISCNINCIWFSKRLILDMSWLPETAGWASNSSSCPRVQFNSRSEIFY